MAKTPADKVRRPHLVEPSPADVIAELSRQYDPKLLAIGLKLLRNWLRKMSR